MQRENELTQVVRALNEAILDATLWPRTSAQIDRACGARFGALCLAEGLTENRIGISILWCFCRGVDRSNRVQEFVRRYCAADELVRRVRRLPDSRIVPVRQLCNEKEQQASEIHNEAMARNHMQDGLIVRMDGPAGTHIVWAIGDPVDRGGWSSSRIDMIARILPHLRQYVRVRSALVDAEALGATAAELLDNARTAVVQLDRRGHIAAANDCAQEIFRRNDGIHDPGGFLRAEAPEDDARLQDLLARALPPSSEQPKSGSTWVRRLSMQPSFILHVTPVLSSDSDIRPQRVAALVLIVDPAQSVRVEPGILGAALGLTPTESEVARLLGDGMSTREIAAATDRHYSTVRTHLKRIFTKLGVSRQADVVRIVLSLSRFPFSVE